MPGIAIEPICELAIPAVRPDTYHLAHVLLGGTFIRFFPEAPPPSPRRHRAPLADDRSIVFPIEDATALCRILATLPSELGGEPDADH
jgi:hypothetical protein